MTEVSIIQKPSTDLHCKSMDWVLYDRDLLHERVKHGIGKKLIRWVLAELKLKFLNTSY